MLSSSIAPFSKSVLRTPYSWLSSTWSQYNISIQETVLKSGMSRYGTSPRELMSTVHSTAVERSLYGPLSDH